MSFTSVIVGRQNVGKSTLFNRLVGKRLAIVDDTPGVTRDRREGRGCISDIEFSIIDTAGLEDATVGSLEARMRKQTSLALDKANVALMLIDARAGITPLDTHFGRWIRRQGVPLILIANKCEGRAGFNGLVESHSLGLGKPIAFSAEHGEGLSELYDALLPYIKVNDYKTTTERQHNDDTCFEDKFANHSINMAIVGRPNVGKSSLVNRILGEDRMLTGPETGITRDAISIKWEYKGQEIKLVDTAGLRKKSKISEKIESLSTGDSLRAIKFAQVVALVLESNYLLEKQDLTIARRVIFEARVLIIVVNKWDLVKEEKKTLQKLSDRLQTSFPQARGIPIVALSAKNGYGTDRLLPTVMSLYDLWNKRIPTAALNRWLDGIIENHPPPITSGQRIKLRYITQAKTRPPTFVVFTSRPEKIPESYMRYLVNSLREDFKLPGVPLRLHAKKNANPYAKKR